MLWTQPKDDEKRLIKCSSEVISFKLELVNKCTNIKMKTIQAVSKSKSNTNTNAANTVLFYRPPDRSWQKAVSQSLENLVWSIEPAPMRMSSS